MTSSPPKHGDIRVCYIPPLLPDHVVVIDVPDMATAKRVYNTVTAISVAEVEHGLRLDPIDLIVQWYTDDVGWDDFDITEYDDNQKTED